MEVTITVTFIRHKVNYRNTHPTTIDTSDPSTLWISKDAHATAWLRTEYPTCLKNIILCCKRLVLCIL
jgi:hypothetical protein